MKARTLIGLALVCMLGFAGLQTGQEYFQKALSKERAEGNLREAIVLYQKAIEASKDEALSAKAQLRIGLCYEKLGLQEAEKAFRLVVEKYPSQSETVKLAKERLDRLSAAATIPAEAMGGLGLRKLDIPAGVPSPDGKYIAAGRTYGDLFIYEIDSKRKTILKSASPEYGNLFYATSSPENGNLAYGASWSPDSSQFACVWRTPKGRNELQIWKLGESEPQLIRLDESVEPGNIAGWALDKNSIYLQYRLHVSAEKVVKKMLARVGIPSGTLENICPLDFSQYNMKLSPDGKYLAFNMDSSPQDHDIRLISTEGREQTVLWKHTGTDYFLSWTPDGGGIIYSGTNFSEYNLCLMGIKNGRPSGSAISVYMFGTRIESADMTKSGSLYIRSSSQGKVVCTAQIDLNNGTVFGPVQAVEPGAMGWVSKPIWSPEGSLLAYFIQKNSTLTTRFHFDAIRIKSITTGKIWEVPLDFEADPDFNAYLQWSADGKAIFVSGNKNHQIGIYRFDLNSRTSEIMPNYENGFIGFGNELSIFYFDRLTPGKKPTEKRHTIVRKNSLTGEEKAIYAGQPAEGLGRIRISPDGSKIGMLSSDFMDLESAGILIIPTNPDGLLTRKEAAFFRGTVIFDWGPEGKGIFTRTVEYVENARKVKTLYYPKIDPSLAPILIELTEDIRPELTFNIDGTTVAFIQSSNKMEFWRLENVWPRK